MVDVESELSWRCFLENLRKVIGNPAGLAIHTDACKGLENAVEIVFPEAEHRECMRHLAGNFKKKFRGKVFDDNLWPAAYTCSKKKYNQHLREMYDENPEVQLYLEQHHGKVWTRSFFRHMCKVDYVTSNLAESFNAKIKGLKSLLDAEDGIAS